MASGDLPDHLLPSAGQSNPFMEKPNPLRWGATVCGVAGVLGVGEGHLLHRKLIGGVGVFYADIRKSFSVCPLSAEMLMQ